MDELTSLQDWQHWQADYKLLPYISVHSLEYDTPPDWLSAWSEAEAYSFVLESGKGGRFSYLGLRPVSIIRGRHNAAEITESIDSTEMAKTTRRVFGSPWDLVQEWMDHRLMPRKREFPPFIGGCVGYWSYDAARSIISLPNVAKDDLGLPDFLFMQFHELYIIDHEQKLLYCSVITPVDMSNPEGSELSARFYEAKRSAETMKFAWERMMGANARERSLQREEAWRRLTSSLFDRDDPEYMVKVVNDFPREQFIQAVERIQESIRLQDVDQVNLSLRQHRPIQSAAEDIYEWLRLINPSPYMGLLRFPDFQIVSGSPELLVKLEGQRITTRPIGGTIRRGSEEIEDQRLISELQVNVKERREHLMLVDLLCDDVRRVAKEGSVRTEELMVIESYSHVHHLVSLISGQLADPYQSYDVLRAMFPGGSVTGAPKRRTMELIEELEPVRRGIYTGSIGWIDYSGDMEFNIVIRTLVIKDQIGYVQAGAGIVNDSIPEREYEESIQKSKALWKAVSCCEASME